MQTYSGCALKFATWTEFVRPTRQEIADKLDWTWCYFTPTNELLFDNHDLVDEFSMTEDLGRYSAIQRQLDKLWNSPSWIAVANIDALPEAVKSIYEHFLTLEKDYKYSAIIARAFGRKAKRAP
jgi:hypothetical protein